ncbi:ribonuclease R [Verrucomicrobiota bacterium]
MNPSEVEERIRSLLAAAGDGSLSVSEISSSLKLRGAARKHLSKWLHRMTVSGDVVRVRADRYCLGAAADLVTGPLVALRSGKGLVESEGDTVFVAQEDLSTALPGDRVVVRKQAEARPDERRRSNRRPRPAAKTRTDRATGKVIRILERARRDIVGTLRTTKAFLYVVPVDPVYKKDFYVPEACGAVEGDRVVIRFTGWENRHVSPEAEVVEVIGPADEARFDTLAIMRHHGLKDEFPEAVMRQAESASKMMEKPGQRLDLRGRLLFTIDPKRARDFDDAVSLETDEQGRSVVGVHIADVAHFVGPDTPLDREARRRGNSVYFPDKVIPMLPEQLSNVICSLNPRQDRLAFSVFMTVDGQGQVVHAEFARSMIRSVLRLTYEQAFSVLNTAGPEGGGEGEGPPVAGLAAVPEVVPALCRMNTIAREMRARRFRSYALDLEVPECEIRLDAKGMPREIRRVEHDQAHQLIEEFMIAANEAVAREIWKRRVPLISRVHGPPDKDRIAALTQELQDLGFAPGDLTRPKGLAEFLGSLEGNPMAHYVRILVLKAMKRAAYDASAKGHFGLAKKFYAHFTSPIRRYADLTVHRQLAALLAGVPPEHTKGDLSAAAAGCTRTEEIADEAARSLIEIKKLRYLAGQISSRRRKAYDATVVSVTNFGLFVDVLDIQVQGLVHVASISDRFVRYDQRTRTLHAPKRVYRVGSVIRVKVSKVDMDSRRVDFVPTA